MVKRMLEATGQLPRSRIEVHSIDVGQGNSVLIELPNGKTLLYDAGPTDAGDTVVSYLKTQGITSLDAIVASHADEDHTGGFLTVLEEIPVKAAYDSGLPHPTQTYQHFVGLIDEKNIPCSDPREGDTLDLVEVP